MDKGREVWLDSTHYLLLMPTWVQTTLSYPDFKGRSLHASDPSPEGLLHRLEGDTALAKCVRAEREVTNLSRPINKIWVCLCLCIRSALLPPCSRRRHCSDERLGSNSESQTRFVHSGTASEPDPWEPFARSVWKSIPLKTQSNIMRQV